ncbi:MAG TPA: GNAT family N-acetyltransferase [Rhizomicrobium sp.]|nr:GNAT family N-acetyltransferase [Rhizomicrobium sp.]
MPPKNFNLRQTTGLVYRAESVPATLLAQVAAIRALADGEKEALGFLPEAAYHDAIEKRRLIAMCTPADGGAKVVGFILFSGVFPNARVQQIVVAKEHRRAHVATALINEVVSQLEARGYLTISAAVASDLPAAQAFYENCGFVARHARRGGQARNRTIILRARDLANESLFSVLEPSPATSQTAIDLGLRLRGASPAPLYAIDLNVLFDVVKGRNRPRSAVAERLIAAALGHQIRLAVAPEFVTELERTTKGGTVDPILALARQLPRLPAFDRTETERLAELVHAIVFVEPGVGEAGSPQALSDARHLAQAALARASGYVTSDGRMLEARDRLLRQIGIDVASLEEFDALLPTESRAQDNAQLKGTGCAVGALSVEAARRYLKQHHVADSLAVEFAPDRAGLGIWRARAVTEAGDTVAVGIYRAPGNIDAPARVLVHVRSDHVACETFADHLLDVQCEEACRTGPITIELPCVPGQAVVRRAAGLRGFLPVSHGETLIKVAVGRPVTAESWPALARQTRRRTGLRLPEAAPAADAVRTGLEVQGPDGKTILVRLPALEDALGPTILIWPGRDGAIVPIARNYADDLLGTNDQFLLFGSPEAAFVTRRTYFNSPRSAPLLRPGLPILFYESLRSGGRGAIVAAARIIDATVVRKEQVSDEQLRRAVVEDVSPLSASSDVLATSFDNLLRFPKPVMLSELRALGAAGTANYQTSTAVTAAHLSAILELGWLRG